MALSEDGMNLQRHMVYSESNSVDDSEASQNIRSASCALSDRSRWLVQSSEVPQKLKYASAALQIMVAGDTSLTRAPALSNESKAMAS